MITPEAIIQELRNLEQQPRQHFLSPDAWGRGLDEVYGVRADGDAAPEEQEIIPLTPEQREHDIQIAQRFLGGGAAGLGRGVVEAFARPGGAPIPKGILPKIGWGLGQGWRGIKGLGGIGLRGLRGGALNVLAPGMGLAYEGLGAAERLTRPLVERVAQRIAEPRVVRKTRRVVGEVIEATPRVVNTLARRLNIPKEEVVRALKGGVRPITVKARKVAVPATRLARAVGKALPVAVRKVPIAGAGVAGLSAAVAARRARPGDRVRAAVSDLTLGVLPTQALREMERRYLDALTAPGTPVGAQFAQDPLAQPRLEDLFEVHQRGR